MADSISRELMARAAKVMPGGVNSPVRAFKSVGGDPVFIRAAKGAHLIGADGTRYIDYIGSWGPMIVGHAHPEVLAAITKAAASGTSFGAPTEAEIDLAEVIIDAVPSIEMVRMVSSGTEAVMGALRAARGFTGRDLVVKFEGCYHGGADYLLVKAGSGAATLGEPDSAGIPAAIASTTLLLPFNNLPALERLFAQRAKEIAAVILEPVVGNMGCVPPDPGFLEGVRRITEQHGALLVFDEVMTGFRLAYGGAQERFGIRPDLTTLGKIVGGGLPVGAYGGRRDIMGCVAPSGPVYQAGTLSGNPLAVAAGLSTLSLLRAPGFYDRLEAASERLAAGLRMAAKRAGRALTVQRVGAMMTAYFRPEKVRNFEDASASDMDAFARFHQGMLARGVYLPPSQYEALFLSAAHDNALIDLTIEAATEVMASL